MHTPRYAHGPPPPVLAASLLVFLACAEPSAQGKPEIQGHLSSGGKYQEVLDAGTIHRYTIDLEVGSALRLEVGQDEVDLVVRVRASSATTAATAGATGLIVDIPIGREAPERLCFVAQSTGLHTVDIEPFRGSGTYALEVTAVRPATPQDRQCAEAFAAFIGTLAASGLSASQAAGQLETSATRLDFARETWLAAVAWREAASRWLVAGAPDRAVADHQRALVLAKRAASMFLEISVLNRLGLAWLDLGDLEQAAGSFAEARDRAAAAGSRRAHASALTNLGRLESDVGTPHAALDSLRTALEIWRGLGDVSQQAQTLINRGRVLGTLGRHADAADALDEALTLTRRAGDKRREADTLFEQGWHHHLRGAPSDGVEPSRQALEISRHLGDRNLEAAVLDRLGTLFAYSGDQVPAQEAYRSALALINESPNPRDSTSTSTNLGCLLVDMAELDEAAWLLTEVGTYFQRTDDLNSAAHIAFCRAKLARALGDPSRALDSIGQALTIVETLRDRARGQGHRYGSPRQWQDYASLAVDLHLDGFAREPDTRSLAAAFEVLDGSRAWSLYEQVVARSALPRAPRPKNLAVRAQQQQARLNLLAATRRSLQERDADANRLAQIEADLRTVARELEDTRAEMRSIQRSAGHLGSPKAATLQQTQRRLPPRSTLLAYRLGEPQSHLFVVTGEAIRVVMLPGRGLIEAHAETFYHALESSLSDDRQWRLVAEALGRMLVPEDAIDDGIERLLVMADGLLHYVPFAALASPRSGHQIGLSGRLVLDDFSLSYIPSAAVLLALEARRQGRGSMPMAAAVFADPVFTPDDPRVTQRATGALDQASASRGITARQLPQGPLPRLPFTADEARTILALTGSPEPGSHEPGSHESGSPGPVAWLGFTATKQAVLDADLSQVGLLHFATHAWIDEDLPELSVLLLSQVDAEGRPIDGHLRLHEIQDLELAADLTVLSGCQTALGKHVRGDGLLGLTHGFFDAGAAQVLVTLWSVDDEATARLMAEFYRRLLTGGQDAAAALRGAQRWLRDQPKWQAPVYWADLVLHGAS